MTCYVRVKVKKKRLSRFEAKPDTRQQNKWQIKNIEVPNRLLVHHYQSHNFSLNLNSTCLFIMVKYKCNFCGKKDLPTQAGLKVHIRLSKAGCREAMERQINRSLSPLADRPIHVHQRRHTRSSSVDENGFPANPSDISYNDFPPFVPSPRHDPSPEPGTIGNEHQWTQGEEAENEDTYLRYAREFPTPAEELGDAKTVFELIFEDQKERNESPWAPFDDKDEWELARWLAKNVTQRATEEFLKMSGVSFINFYNC
jgi:hypothetical protein